MLPRIEINVLENIFDLIYEEDRRKHELQLQELAIIADSNLRDQLAVHLIVDRFLAPVEQAQFLIQDTAKHSQYLAEAIGYYYRDHGMTQEEAKTISKQFRVLAIKLTEGNSLHELKIIYKAVTNFLDEISRFKHREIKYSIEHEVRTGILDRLNCCIANHENFQRRIDLLDGGHNIRLNQAPRD
jgi:hypothetical protein